MLAIAAHTVETQQKPANVPSHVYLDQLSAKEKERYGHKVQVSASNTTTQLFDLDLNIKSNMLKFADDTKLFSIINSENDRK